MSAILYVICVEPLLCRIRCDPSIKGLKPGGGGPEIKLTSYADDNNPIVTSIPSIQRVFDTSVQFGWASGGRLHLGKSTGILLGAAKQWSLPDAYCGIEWVPFSRVLGCQLGICNINKENWGPVLEEVKEAIVSHSNRWLSLRGKAVVANSVILTKLWYVGKIISMPRSRLDEINQKVVNFVWGEHTKKLAQETLFLRPSEGGVGLTNIELKLRAFRIMHIIDFLYGDQHGPPSL